MASQKDTYEEIGIIIDADAGMLDAQPTFDGENLIQPPVIKKGDKVYFDAWLAAKYPKNETEFYWLVKWEDVRAIEHAES